MSVELERNIEKISNRNHFGKGSGPEAVYGESKPKT